MLRSCLRTPQRLQAFAQVLVFAFEVNGLDDFVIVLIIYLDNLSFLLLLNTYPFFPLTVPYSQKGSTRTISSEALAVCWHT